MPIIDDKIVAMSFENSKFESGVSQTLSSLDKLKAALKFGNAGKGLSDLDAAGKKVNLSHIASAVDTIKSRLSLLGIAGAAVFTSLALKAVSAAGRIAKAFTVGPMMAGFREYSTNLNSIQTILANTEAAGTNLQDVNAALAELNEYSDKTIYNFSQMAKNIGTFTAAGVDLDASTAAIKGIANLAALSGSNAEQAASAMYQLSQALSAGRVNLMDWNSVVNAGMGGTVFQRALANTAVQMGTLKENAVTLKGAMKNVTIEGKSFRNSLAAGPGKESWLTSDVLTKTLKQFTGDLKDAELAAMGFNKEQIKSIQQTAQTAMHAATEVKTIQQVFDVAKETAGSGWAKTFQILFGDFEEAKSTFTDLSNAVNGFINKTSDARNSVLSDWKELGGRTVLIESIQRAFTNLGMVLKPIKEAFRDIFPAQTGADLMYLTQRFEAFTYALKPSKATIDGLRRTFAGIFALFSIGISIVKGIFTAFSQMFGAMGEGSGSFLNFTGSIGDFLVSLDKAIKQSEGFKNFFVTLGDILAKPIEMLFSLGGALSGLFKGFSKSSSGFTDSMGAMGDATSGFASMMQRLSEIWTNFTDSFKGGGGSMQGFVDGLVKSISALGPAIGEATANMNFELILDAIRTGFFGALVIMIKRFLGPGSLLNQLFGRKGILNNITESFSALRGSMVAMQNNIRADTLQKIAVAIGILTLSIVALSLVDPDRLVTSLTAISVGFGILVGAMQLLSMVGTSKGFIKIPFIAASLILLAGSIVVLSAAVLMLSLLSWEDLAKGLAGVGVLLASIAVAVKPLSANSAGMIRAGAGIMAIAAALLTLSIAVQIMGRMDMQTLGKGLGGITAGLALMVTAMSNMPVVPLRSTAGIVAMAGALILLATAVQIMGRMDLMTLGKGLIGITVGLRMMVLAMSKMPTKGMLAGSAGLILVAVALQGIARAVSSMGGLSWEELGKGLAGLGGSLAILAAGLHLMTGTVAGSIALTTAASAMALLVPALIAMGKQSWETIIKGLAGLAGALLILGIAGVAMAGVAPALLAAGAALVLMGTGLALVGAGIALIGIGLSAITVALPTAVGILIAAIIQFMEAVPRMVTSFVTGLLAIVQAFSATAPAFVDAIVKIVDAILDGIVASIPKMVVTFGALLAAGLKVIAEHGPKIIQAGFKLLGDFLQGLKNHTPKIVPTVADIIVRFLNSLANNMSKIVNAGTNLLISFLRGISSNFNRVVATVGTMITSFLTAVANQVGKITAAGLNILVKFLQGIANNLGRVIKAGTDIIVNFIVGIGNAGGRIVTAAVQAITKFIRAIAKGAVKLVDEGMKAIILFLNGVADAIEANSDEMREAGVRVAVAIIDGMTGGLIKHARRVIDAAADLGRKALGALGKAIKFFSPSKEAMKIGVGFSQGFALGITPDQAARSATAMGQGVITAVTDVLEIHSPSRVMYNIGKFVGQGFADGLRGSTENIKSAYQKMNEKLTESMRSTRETITSEQDRLAQMLKEKQEKLNEINEKKFKKETDKAKALAEVHKHYEEPIRESQKLIAENERLLARLSAGNKTFIKNLKDEKNELLKLSVEYKKLGERIKEAQTALENAIKLRDDFQLSTAEKYQTTPDISEPLTEEIASARESIAREKQKLEDMLAEPPPSLEKPEKATQKDLDALLEKQKERLDNIAAQRKAIEAEQTKLDEMLEGKVLNEAGTSVDQLATYLKALDTQATAVAAYSSTLEQLRKLGLDEKTYRKLVEEGTADQSFANQLLAGGKTAVESLNVLDEQLKTVSETLATNAAKKLYQAGVTSAEGFIKGLESQKSALEKAMKKIGDAMVKALKKSLKIKSPSEVFAEVGRYSMEGMALGVSNSSSVVTSAVETAGRDAMYSLRKTMRGLHNLVLEEMDSTPVITPILDLSTIRTQTQELAALTNISPITAGTSYGHASVISSEHSSAQAGETIDSDLARAIVFEQNNYSPKALTEIEIYRQTRNQLSQLKSVF